jgi:murein DD-endopeptidase MepM/ murein hydrolase activator NlpD
VKRIVGITVGLTVGAMLCCGTPAAYFMEGLAGNPIRANASGCGHVGQLVDTAAKVPSIGSLTDDQMHNAAVIISVGQRMQVPARGWVVAIGTALQESVLNNIDNLGSHNDHDSLGLFQQRPSMGWGTHDQIMDPVYSSTKFYERLLTIAGWESMPLTEAAQAVQRSAYPDAYAKHEPLAASLVDALAAGAAKAIGALGALRCASAGEIAASGWTQPVVASIVSPFGPRGGVLHAGVDLGVPKNTPIHAASSGIVRTVKCNVSAGDCDHDGSPAIKGCGWYVDIEHAAGVITRYCHQLRHPDVQEGQTVNAGQVIGVSGTSGNSSGPHLHFEVHQNGDSSNAGAIDPVPFMAGKGAPLGKVQQ